MARSLAVNDHEELADEFHNASSLVGGLQRSVLDLVRTCKRMTTEQNRNQRGRYQTLNCISTSLVNDPVLVRQEGCTCWQ
jgi:hypothetical protein